MAKHKGSRGCDRAMAVKCHCVVIDGGKRFWPCCGDYCNKCGGRIEDGNRRVHRLPTKDPTP